MQIYQHALAGMQADAAATFGTIVFGDVLWVARSTGKSLE